MAFLAPAIATIATTVGAAFAEGGFFTTFFGRILLAVASSALQMMLAPKPKAPGIKTKVTQTGGTNPCAFPLLKYMTAGTHVCPPMSQGSAGGHPNAYLTYVVILSDIPGASLSRLQVNGEYVTLAGTSHPDYGQNVTGTMANNLWIKVYDGSQTTADPMLLTKFGSYPERPWSSDMIGRGLVYAIVTFKYKRKVFPGLPRVRFEMNGIPLYDPRKDSTVGGSGAHRWATPSTWEQTVNPVVGIYNVMRGITLPDGSVWGGKLPADDLPLASWFAAMNECDVSTSNGAGGFEPQFRAGWEVTVDDEPADVISELLKACTGQMAEVGGYWKIRVGAPGVPVMSLTDADIVVSRDRNFHPFPTFASSYNGAHATYPDPESGWEAKDALPYYVPAYEAADGGQRLVADLNMSAVPYPAQVRRLMFAGVEEERRFRRHDATLPPDFALLEPLDSLSWTSTENGYTTKTFEVSGLTEDPMTALQRVMVRERNAADFSYPSLPAPAAISILAVIPADQTVPSFNVAGVSITDATGANRRPALELTWDPEDLIDATGLQWEIRVQATGVVVARGSTHDVGTGSLLVSEGLVANTAYEARPQSVTEMPSVWGSWDSATTPNTLISRPDVGDGAISDQFQLALSGPYDRAATPDGTVLGTLSIGAIPPGNGYRRFTSLWIRASAGNNAKVQLQSRKKEEGGAWSAWTLITEFSLASGVTTWDQQSDQGGIAGSYDDWEYRWITTARPGSGAGYDWLRGMYLTLTKVTK